MILFSFLAGAGRSGEMFGEEMSRDALDGMSFGREMGELEYVVVDIYVYIYGQELATNITVYSRARNVCIYV